MKVSYKTTPWQYPNRIKEFATYKEAAQFANDIKTNYKGGAAIIIYD